ncbi:MAG TPA: hypothetical protein VGE59_01395 [Patescibacteria group bacterium]
MQTKQALKVLGTFLFLLGVFGYIFPNWKSVHFTNNENLFHVISGLIAITASNLKPRGRTITLGLLIVFYLAWGIWGFTLHAPLDAKILIKNKINLSTQLDTIDNYLHILFGLGFAWSWLNRKHSQS